MGLLHSSSVQEPVSPNNHIVRQKMLICFSAKRQLRMKLVSDEGGSVILLLYPRLMLVAVTDVFHTVAKASSVSFNVCRQVFATAKIFELERLMMEKRYHLFHLF